MKKLLTVSTIAVLGLSSVAFAGGLPEEMPVAPIASSCCADSGVYLGIGAGYGLSNWNNQSLRYSVTDSSGFSGRAFLGYDINRYFAAEVGYDHFFKNAKVANTIGSDNYTKYKTKIVDLLGKGKIPVTDEFSLFAKLGVSYLMSHATDNGNGYANDAGAKSKSPKTLNVAFGAGMDYCITPNVVASLEWLRATGKAKINSANYQPNADTFLVGLRYKFDL